MFCDECTDRFLGVVDGEVEGGLSNNGDAFTRDGEDVGILLVVFDEWNTPGGESSQIDYIYTGAGIREDGYGCAVIQACPDSWCGTVDRGAADGSNDSSGLCRGVGGLGLDGVDGWHLGAGDIARPVGGTVGINPTAGVFMARRMAIETNCRFASFFRMAYPATLITFRLLFLDGFLVSGEGSYTILTTLDALAGS